MLTQINYTIVTIFSGTLIVTVNIYIKKTTETLYLKVKWRVFLSNDTRRKYIIKTLLKSSIVLSCAKKHRNFLSFWQPFFVLLIWRLRSPIIECMSNYRQKFREKKSCFRFQPMLNTINIFNIINMFSLKKYRTSININSTHFQTYTYLGLENIGQIWICPMITFS